MKFLLSLVKGLIPEIVDDAILVAIGKLREDVHKSKFLNDAEKETTIKGAELLAARTKEELQKQLKL